MFKLGQVFSLDLIFSLTVFLFVLVTVVNFSNSVSLRVGLVEVENERDFAAITVANALVLSEGRPVNWQNLNDFSSVVSLGVAKQMNVVDKAKFLRLGEFAQLDYFLVRDLLGVGRYGLHVSVLGLQSGQVLAEMGVAPPFGKSASTVNRLVLFDGVDAVLRVRVFEQ